MMRPDIIDNSCSVLVTSKDVRKFVRLAGTRYRDFLFCPLPMGTLETDEPRQTDARLSTRCEVARRGHVQARHIDGR